MACFGVSGSLWQALRNRKCVHMSVCAALYVPKLYHNSSVYEVESSDIEAF